MFYYVLSRLHYLSKFQELFCFVRVASAAKIDAARITRRLINQRVHVPTLDSITNKWNIKVLSLLPFSLLLQPSIVHPLSQAWSFPG